MWPVVVPRSVSPTAVPWDDMAPGLFKGIRPRVLLVYQIKGIHDTHGGSWVGGQIHSEVGIGYARVSVIHFCSDAKGIKGIRQVAHGCEIVVTWPITSPVF